MEDSNVFEDMIRTVIDAQSFAVLGGDLDEYMRFIQLEWESYAQSIITEEEMRRFYKALLDYKAYRNGKPRDWRKDFEGRNHFATIV